MLIVHRDCRGAMKDIQPHFDEIAREAEDRGLGFHTWNADAIAADKRSETIDSIAEAIGPEGKVRPSTRSLEPEADRAREGRAAHRERRARQAPRRRRGEADRGRRRAFDAGTTHPLVTQPKYPDTSYLDEEDFGRTILAMGTSLLGWTQELFSKGLFAPDTRIFGMTSEGNEVAWKGYAAVSAAKVSLESLARRSRSSSRPTAFAATSSRPVSWTRLPSGRRQRPA